jgi:hypothetical protein
MIEKRDADGITYFRPVGQFQTRGQQTYCKVSTYSDGHLTTEVPCTIGMMGDGCVVQRSKETALVKRPSQPTPFFEFLHFWGGKWMWTNITNEGTNLQWVVNALQHRPEIWVTDSSYNKKTAPTISGAGWIVHRTACNKRTYINSYERSTQAGSYRVELLGLLAIHRLESAIKHFYSINIAATKIYAATTKDHFSDQRRSVDAFQLKPR